MPMPLPLLLAPNRFLIAIMNDCDETTYLSAQLEIATKGHQYYCPHTSNKSVNFRLLHPSSLTATIALFDAILSESSCFGFIVLSPPIDVDVVVDDDDDDDAPKAFRRACISLNLEVVGEWSRKQEHQADGPWMCRAM